MLRKRSDEPTDEAPMTTTSTVAAASEQLQAQKSADGVKSISPKAAAYVTPGEAYTVVKRGELKTNAKVDGTKFGRFL